MRMPVQVGTCIGGIRTWRVGEQSLRQQRGRARDKQERGRQRYGRTGNQVLSAARTDMRMWWETWAAVGDGRTSVPGVVIGEDGDGSISSPLPAGR